MVTHSNSVVKGNALTASAIRGPNDDNEGGDGDGLR